MRLVQLSAALLACACLSLGLAACNADPNEEAVQCPRAHVLPDADHVSRYNGRGTDITDLVLSARITDVQGACSGKLGTRKEGAHAHVVMVVTRGPAANSAEADVAYKIGVMHGADIIAERSLTQHVVFPPNVTTLQVTGEEVPMLLPLTKDVTGPSYSLFFWLDLSPAEVAANRRMPGG